MTDSTRPVQQVVEGMTWDVRLTVLTKTGLSTELLERANVRFRTRGVRCYVGWAQSEIAEALTASMLVDSETLGSAADVGMRHLLDVTSEEGIETPIVQEVVVVPAWRDERDWSIS
jgi:hypothetical protein